MAKVTYDAKQAQCRVVTFKEGLFAAAGHDLALAFERFEIVLDEEKREVTARIEAASVRVLGAMRGGQIVRGVLSERDLRDIEKSARTQILDAANHPEIRFTSAEVTQAGNELIVAGRLTLRGTSRRVVFPVREEPGPTPAADGSAPLFYVARHELHQPDYGIPPFSALLGALKIKPGVRILVRVSKLGAGAAAPAAS